MDQPKLYTDLAPWWPLVSPPSEYADEAAFARDRLIEACNVPPRTVLELGSGGGNNASHLKTDFEMTLVELSEGMLAVSRDLNPDCEHFQGDMRSVRLGRVFDAVFVHDAVMYMTTEGDLRKAIETAFVHCRPGGAALFQPDYVSETFKECTAHGGEDGTGQAIRWLEWAWDPDPSDSTITVDYGYLLRDADGAIHVGHDRHTCGVFPKDLWLRLLRDVGFAPQAVRDQYARDSFVARRPA